MGKAKSKSKKWSGEVKSSKGSPKKPGTSTTPHPRKNGSSKSVFGPIKTIQTKSKKANRPTSGKTASTGSKQHHGMHNPFEALATKSKAKSKQPSRSKTNATSTTKSKTAKSIPAKSMNMNSKMNVRITSKNSREHVHEVPTKAVGPNHRSKFKRSKLGLGLPPRSNFRVDNRKTTYTNARVGTIPLRTFTRPKFQLRLPPNECNQHVIDMPWSSNYNSNPNHRQQQQQQPAKSHTDQKKASSKSTPSTNLRIMESLRFDEHVLSNLDQELNDFSLYIGLTPHERDAREHVIQYVTDAAGSLFGCTIPKTKLKPLPKRKRPKSERQEQDNGVTVQVFGSYATPQVCTFASDVDLALWGVVPPSHSSSTEQHITFDDNGNDRDMIPLPEMDSKQSTKQKRIQKWRELLAEADPRTDENNDNDGDDDYDNSVDSNNRNADDAESSTRGHGPFNLPNELRKQKWKDALSESSIKNSNKDVKLETKESCSEIMRSREKLKLPDGSSSDKVSSKTAQEQQVDNQQIDDNSSSSSSSNKQTPSQSTKDDLLFVIDRVGETEFHTDNAETGGTANTKGCKPSTEGTNATLLIGDNRQENILAGSSKDEPLVIDDSSPSVLDLRSDSDTDDSDDDTADKLESFQRDRGGSQGRGDHVRSNPQQRYKRHQDKRQRTVSLSSTTSGDSSHKDINGDDDDNEDSSDDPFNQLSDFRCDDSGMQVSFINRAKVQAHEPPTAQIKKKIANALWKLGGLLRQSPLTYNVEVRAKARVPIINMTTNLGFEGDIAVGGHAGADTSQYAATQVDRFQSFATVVLFLKILLNQQGLDKPFTGGLGSYKLYVLVAHHLERHLAIGGLDRPSEVLLTFFYRYSYDGLGTNSKNAAALTGLSQNVVLRSEGGSADLQPVFQIEKCIELFQTCRTRLGGLLKEQDEHGSVTLLGCLVNAQKLQYDRDESIRKALSASKNHFLSPCSTKKHIAVARDHPGKVSAGRRQVNHVFSKGSSDDTAGKSSRTGSHPPTPKGISVKNHSLPPLARSSRGGLTPKYRPDVEAREATRKVDKLEQIQRSSKRRKSKKKQTRDQALLEFANREI